MRRRSRLGSWLLMGALLALTPVIVACPKKAPNTGGNGDDAVVNGSDDDDAVGGGGDDDQTVGDDDDDRTMGGGDDDGTGGDGDDDGTQDGNDGDRPTTAASSPPPPRSAVKELLKWAPRWVLSGPGGWDCMERGANGWVPKRAPGCEPVATSAPVFNVITLGTFTRDVYDMTFTERVDCPAPQTYTADVVFENYQEEIKTTDYRDNSVPVLVTQGEKKTSATQWQYERVP